ncbi:MAG: S49 family peptidase [Deltaproteobacteria bacterium]|nr:S49 family peptidase [Deltaproteobacteria bacterium]
MNEKAVLTRLAGRIINTPLMIQREMLDIILSVIGVRIGLQVPMPLTAQDWIPANPQILEETHERIAVIPVHGSLVHRTGGLTTLSGLTSYEQIRADFRQAMDDADADATLFDIESHGGEVAGVFDLVDEIYEARGQKPIYAMVNEMALSAAYAIASAADRIFLPRTGLVGSIGVIAEHVDQSAFDVKEGLKYTTIFAGARKNDFSPHQELSTEAYKIIHERVMKTRDLFVDTVARNRNVEAAAIMATEAGSFQGQAAIDAGLADEIMSWDQAIKYINSNTKQGGQIMSTNPITSAEFKTQLQELLTMPDMDAGAVLAELGYVPRSEEKPVDLEKITADAVAQGRKDAMDTMTGILDLCVLGGVPEMAAGFLKEGVSVEDARKKILEYKAVQDGKDEIISTVGPNNTGEVNPLLADARKRRDQAAPKV